LNNQTKWRDHLTRYASGIALFDQSFLDRWGNQPWPLHDDPASADDIVAAAKLHVQLISRITTQRLNYADGVEAAALKSVYELFGEARDIFKKHPKCRLTDAISWHVLNTRIRPFTEKWHRQSERGALSAVDATDVFRHELSSLQKVLARFDELLVEIRDGAQPPPPQHDGESDRDRRIRQEMQQLLEWGIDPKLGGLIEDTARQINAKENEAVKARRLHYHKRLNPPARARATNANTAPAAARDETGPSQGIVVQVAATPRQPSYPQAWVDRPHATALAISGGGIRSATFALGVLVALARRNLLFQFDYLSTVSGGGYLGSFLTTFLNALEPADRASTVGSTAEQPKIGLLRSDLPFRREDGEAAALRHVRHHSKYLVTGRLWERLQMTFTQVYGMALNGLGFAYLAVLAAVAEYALRQVLPLDSLWLTEFLVFAAVAGASFLISMAAHSRPNVQNVADTAMTVASLGLIALLLWRGLEELHVLGDTNWPVIAGAAALPLFASALLALSGNLPFPIRIVLIVLSFLAAPILFFGIEVKAYKFLMSSHDLPVFGMVSGLILGIAVVIAGPILFWFFFDINFTSPHRYYKRKLGEAYLVQPDPANPDAPLFNDVSLLLSKCIEKQRAPYHLVNCALNVPASDNSAMQGRLTDFFLFSPCFSGSPLMDYRLTYDWEHLNPALDLGTAMAISGAAAAPQMGTGTIKNFTFWLALFNVRLGYWIRNPSVTRHYRPETPPGLFYLLQEMFGWANEKRAYVNVSDGGHIENLGVYELLRRRCKFIVAIDGEQDPKMTFHGLTTLQRLAFIDLGVTIDIGLDALRLGDKGLSNSHFAFCRLHYPSGSRDGTESYGYLIYLKLSLTGNEGEFIRRYRLDEPAFPHHSTANQFFTEAQFEAYRSLGEHVGDKMFLPAIVGSEIAPSNDVELEKWFLAIGKSMLEPLPQD
jgi:hypothetical protein